MILLREISDADLSALEHFAQIPGMFNLPSDRDLLRERIQRSRSAFLGKITRKSDTKFTFVAEDTLEKKVIATSLIVGQHGTPESPHFFFEVGNEKKFSQTINTGFIHGTLTLKYLTDGPSEIGALVVDPDHRNSPARAGRQISFARFLYLSLHPERFQGEIIAELLPPLNKRGRSPLWEAVGRRFTNMDYWEADLLCAKDKEFIFSLFPSGKIYTTFLPGEARNSVGNVGKETEPVRHMLSKIGFQYRNQIDPFDGGPHLWASTKELKPLLGIKDFVWSTDPNAIAGLFPAPGLMARSAPGEFRAVAVSPESTERELTEAAALLELRSGDSVRFMPYY